MTWQVPLDDDGDGGVVAEIHLTGEVTWGALIQLGEILGRASTPVPIVFQPIGPPPLCVSIHEAAQSLGMSTDQVRRFIRSGDLEAVTIPEGPTDIRNARVIPWEALVAFTKRARDKGHFPVIPTEPQRPPTGGADLQRLIVNVLREAYETNPEQGLPRGEIRRSVEAHLDSVGNPRKLTVTAIETAIRALMRTNRITREKRGLRRYRWNPTPRKVRY